MVLRTAQIGRCGELLVQYKLLLRGIESAPMTTDAGIDLVAYSPRTLVPRTIQVKTNLKPKPSGGRGRPLLDWWLPHESPAQLIALVDLSQERVWIFLSHKISEIAQQRSQSRYHVFMHSDSNAKPRRDGRPVHEREFTGLLLEECGVALFDA